MKSDAAGIFFTDGQQVLVLKRASNSTEPNTWSMPGGGAKSQETAIQTAQREAKEECGLSRIPGVKIAQLPHGSWATFVYKVVKKFPVRLSKEHSDWQWIDLSEINKLKLHPQFKKQLPDILRTIRRNFRMKFKEWFELNQTLTFLE